MKFKLLALAAAFVAGSATAAVTYDENGVGFVGKGDVQALYDWNNAMLQANASELQFRFIAASTVTWVCEWWTGKEPNRQYHAKESEASVGVSAAVAVDSRKNSKGQVTGFNLTGLDGAVESYASIGDCNGQGAGKTLKPDSINYEGSEEPLLQVRFGETGDWMDLPITL